MVGDFQLLSFKLASQSKEEETLLSLPISQVSDIENNLLVGDVIKEEIRAAIWVLARDKAPSLDGFPLFFL